MLTGSLFSFPFGNLELDGVFVLPYLVAHAAVTSLGQAVGKDADVHLVRFGGRRTEVRPVEGLVLAVHIVRHQVPLVKTNLTVDVVGRAPTIIRYVEDDGRLWVL